MPDSPYVRRLTDEENIAVSKGQMLAELENGTILEKPQIWDDLYRGTKHKSLLGYSKGRLYRWPKCGCGVKIKLRAIPLPPSP